MTISYLKSIENKGDCFELAGKIEDAINEYPLFYKSEYELPDAVLSDPEDPLLDHFMEKIVIKEHKNKLFFYLKEIYEKEIFISDTIIKLMNLNDLPAKFMVNLEESIITLNQKFEGKFDVETYRTERQKLFSNIFKKKFYVLSGSPGSGKSYELLRIVDKLQKASEDCLILTPTGKAALRLSSNEEGFKNIRVMTIDKFLYDNRGKDIFDIENVIIDEMSMVDLIKFAELLRKFNFNLSISDA